jgi:hypothetical protein
MNPHWPIPARQTRIESGERHICVDEFFDLARLIEFDPFRALADTPLIQCAARSCTPQANSTSRIRCCPEALRLVTGRKHVHSLP